MYELVTGPLLWLSFIVFVAGVIWRFVWYVKGLNWQLDRVAYRAWPKYGFKGAVRSVVMWLIPFGTKSWRVKPVFTIVFFLFHFGLLFTPIFLQAHNIILRERWGFSLWTISDGTADFLTIMVMVLALFIILRRIALPEVRIITTWSDYGILAIAVAPFITGFIAMHSAANYNFWLIAHVLSGELWLVAIPFTKLSHFILFFMSRIQLGMDYGIKRGGMKSKGMAW